jgi:hypothetical protein
MTLTEHESNTTAAAARYDGCRRPGHHPAASGFYRRTAGCNCRSTATTAPSECDDEPRDEDESSTWNSNQTKEEKGSSEMIKGERRAAFRSNNETDDADT